MGQSVQKKPQDSFKEQAGKYSLAKPRAPRSRSPVPESLCMKNPSPAAPWGQSHIWPARMLHGRRWMLYSGRGEGGSVSWVFSLKTALIGDEGQTVKEGPWNSKLEARMSGDLLPNLRGLEALTTLVVCPGKIKVGELRFTKRSKGPLKRLRDHRWCCEHSFTQQRFSPSRA